jgi:hypothetical protein
VEADVQRLTIRGVIQNHRNTSGGIGAPIPTEPSSPT